MGSPGEGRKTQTVSREQIRFLFLNVGHFVDHLVLLVFATVAALSLRHEWNLTYAELIPYATPGLVAFGVCTLPAGWIADKWSREGMMLVFFLGLGVTAVLTALAETPLQIGAGLFLIGLFASIYHPVGLAMVVEGRTKTGVPLAVNGVFGNLGVACSALLTGFLIDAMGWRAAFALPGALCIALGCAYGLFVRSSRRQPEAQRSRKAVTGTPDVGTGPPDRRLLIRVFSIVLVSTALGGLIFQATTFSLPKIFEERLDELADTTTLLGWYTFLVVTVAAFAQLVVGYLVDRYSVRAVFAGVAALQVAFFLAMQDLAGWGAVAIATGFMLGVFGQIPINDVLIGRLAASAWRSRAFAGRYIVTFSVAATAVPLIAQVHAHWDFAVLFLLLAAAASLILLAALMLPSTRRFAAAHKSATDSPLT